MTALWLLAPLVLGQAVAVEIEVLSLTGAFSARTPGGSARARAGEPLPALPAGSAVTVEEGEAVFRALGAVISASPRQSFSVREAPGGAHLEFLGPGTLSARLGGARVWLSPGALLWFDGRAGFALAAGEGEYAPAGAGGRRALRKGKPVEAPAAPALDDASDPLALPEPESSTPTLRLTLGALELIPYYRAALLYDDNIYRVPTPSTGSWITESSLGASAALPWRWNHRVEFGYELQARQYGVDAGENDALNQRISGAYQFRAMPVTVRLEDRYLATEDPPAAEESVIAGELTRRGRRWENDFAVKGRWEAERAAGALHAAVRQYHFLDRRLAKGLNRSQTFARLRLEQRHADGRTTFLWARRELVHHSALPDLNPTGGLHGQVGHYKGWTFAAGMEGALGPRLTGTAELGFEGRRYDRDEGGSGPELVSHLNIAADLAYQIARNTRADLRVRRGLVPGLEGGPFASTTGARFSVRHELGRWRAEATAAAQTDRYAQPPLLAAGPGRERRRDDLYEAGFDVSRRLLRWLTASLTYRFQSRFSIFSGSYGYRAHSAGLSASARAW